MKDLLIAVLLFTFTFPLFTLQAQDTLVLRNGKKMGVKVISFADQIAYSIPPDIQQYTIKAAKVSYIKYGDGTVSKINNADFSPNDTEEVKAKPYLVFSGGASLPLSASGYGANGINTNETLVTEYSGDANNGPIFSATAGLALYNGWGAVAMFSYIQNGFNATGVLFETNYDYIHMMESINAIGSYYFNNYSCLLGIEKNWKRKYGGIGISIMAGDLITSIPAIQGAGQYYKYANGNQIFSNGYLKMNSETQRDFDFELGVHGDFKITPQLFIRVLVEFQFSGITYEGNYQITDAASGNTVNSGGYDSGNLFLGLFDATAGIGYKF